jgi:hypothetical protein
MNYILRKDRLNDREYLQKFIDYSDFGKVYKLIEHLRKKGILRNENYILFLRMLYLAKAHYDLIVKREV